MKFVMTQAVCPEGMQLLDGIADVYVCLLYTSDAADD